MALASLNNQFTVSSVPVTLDGPTRINIKKRRAKIAYRTLSDRDNINISYLVGEETIPSNNLFIADRSTSLTQNRIPSSTDLQTDSTSVLTLNVDKFLVTDIFTVDQPTKAATPLFFVHTLSNFDSTSGSGQSLLSVEFADRNLKSKQITEYVLDVDTGKLYNNIANSYNQSIGDIDITFVKYTVRTVSGSSQTIQVYHELISNKPIFAQATFDDIDEFGNLDPNSKKYIVEEQAGGQLFQVTLPQVTTYAFKETPESRISVLSPTAQDVNNPWYVRITNGRFITSLQKDANQFYNYKYYIAEFNTQIYSPFPPYKFQPEQQAIWLTNSLIKVPKNIVVDEGLKLFVDVIVKGIDGSVKYAYSNDTDKVGTIYSDSSIAYTDGILSIDKQNGFIELSDSIRDDDTVLVNYYTEENQYEFTSVDFNPANNIDILNQRIVLYLAPENIFTGQLGNTLHYLVVNSLGEITFCSQALERSESLDVLTSKLIDEDFDVDGTPKHTFYYDKPSSESGLLSRVSGVYTEYIDEFSFIDKYTVESTLLNTTSLPSGTSLENYEENPRILVLSDIFVGENQSPESLTSFDVRVHGGGIKEELKSASLKIQPELSWNWDFIGNQYYPSAGAFMVEVPKSLLSDYGGDFTEQQVRAVIDRHMSFGGYAVLRPYGIDPVITERVSTSGTITFGWPSYGSDISYNAYYSSSQKDGFLKINSNPIVDDSSGNSITVSGLNASTKYFAKVGAIDQGNIETIGSTISITTSSSVVS